MSSFEFFMAFYGLLLGLAFAELMNGFASLLRERVPPKLGVITPIIAAIVFVEMLANFVDAWNRLQEVRIAFFPLLVPTIIGLIYFLVAVILVPRDLHEWQTLNDYFDRRKRWIVGLLLGANIFIIATTTPAALSSAILTASIGRSELVFILINVWLIGGYAVLLLARRRWLEIAAALAIFLFYPVTYSGFLNIGIAPAEPGHADGLSVSSMQLCASASQKAAATGGSSRCACCTLTS